jgi:AcrR family transcriptional regulator
MALTKSPSTTHRGRRMTADERRDAVIAAATEEFARCGLVGASVDAIARRVGVSQPYVFQLFGTKKQLFLATVRSCFERVGWTFEDAARNWKPADTTCDSKLGAMGLAYKRLLADRTLLMLQMQAYAACSDAEVQEVVRACWIHLYNSVERVTGTSREEIHHFFGEGMLLNLGAAVGLPGEATEWSLEMLGEGA